MTRFTKRLMDECDDLHGMFRDCPEDKTKQDLERRYKVVVMAILPILLSRLQIIFTTLSFFLGVALALLFESLIQ